MTHTLISAYDIIVHDEAGDKRVTIKDGIGNCACKRFLIDRACPHTEYLEGIGFLFKPKRRPKDGYEFITRHGESIIKNLRERYIADSN